jgi:hypothetical protein
MVTVIYAVCAVGVIGTTATDCLTELHAVGRFSRPEARPTPN